MTYDQKIEIMAKAAYESRGLHHDWRNAHGPTKDEWRAVMKAGLDALVYQEKRLTENLASRRFS